MLFSRIPCVFDSDIMSVSPVFVAGGVCVNRGRALVQDRRACGCNGISSSSACRKVGALLGLSALTYEQIKL